MQDPANLPCLGCANPATHHVITDANPYCDNCHNLPCISCDAPSTHRTPDGYPVCDNCHPARRAALDAIRAATPQPLHTNLADAQYALNRAIACTDPGTDEQDLLTMLRDEIHTLRTRYDPHYRGD